MGGFLKLPAMRVVCYSAFLMLSHDILRLFITIISNLPRSCTDFYSTIAVAIDE